MSEELKIKTYPKIRSLFKRDKDFKFTERFVSSSLKEFSEGHFKWSGYEKIDGMNIRIYCNYETNIFKYFGRTEKAELPAHLVEELDGIVSSIKENKEAIVEAMGFNIFVLFGEGFGHKIQKGGLYLGDKVACNMFDCYAYIVRAEQYKGFWLDEEKLTELLEILKLQKPPSLGKISTAEAVEKVKKGFSSQYGTAPAEGLILKTDFPVFDSFGERMIFKVKTKDF